MHFNLMIIGDEPEDQLEDFDENKRVERYVEKTKVQLIEEEKKGILKRKILYYDKYLEDPEKFLEDHKDNKNFTNYYSVEFPKILKQTDEELYQNAIRYYDDIGPDGEIYSTYNPKSKWDWYEIGGRWKNMINKKRKIEKIDYESDPFGEEDAGGQSVNQALLKDIENFEELKTYAVLKNGEWYEKDNDPTNLKRAEEWDDVVKDLKKDLPEDTLISIYDCHI